LTDIAIILPCLTENLLGMASARHPAVAARPLLFFAPGPVRAAGLYSTAIAR